MIRLRTVKLVIFGENPAAAGRFKIFFLTLFVFWTKKGKTEYFTETLNTLKVMKLLEGKVAVVTGAARGIGKAIALEFAKEGADVAFTDLAIDENGKATEAEIAALGVKAKGYASNAANFEETHKVIEEIVKDFGRIDILVNNAGITKDGLMMRMSEAQWDAVLTVNLKSAFNFIHAVTPIMARQKGGSIINMSSVVGVSGNAGQCNYSASKAGMIGLAKSIAKEMGPRGIRANAIAPGFIMTEMTDKLNELDINFWQLTMDGFMVGGYMAVPNSILMDDSDLQLATTILQALAASLAKAIDKSIWFGTGENMPVGIITRLAATAKPTWWGSQQAAFTDLHTSHILKLDIASKTGVEFFQPLVAALAVAKPDYSNGTVIWTMNRKTHMDLMSRALAYNSAAAMVAGVNNTMPVVGGEIVEWEVMPDNEIAGGFMSLYRSVEREGTSIESNTNVRWLENQTCFKGMQRRDRSRPHQSTKANVRFCLPKAEQVDNRTEDRRGESCLGTQQSARQR